MCEKNLIICVLVFLIVAIIISLKSNMDTDSFANVSLVPSSIKSSSQPPYTSSNKVVSQPKSILSQTPYTSSNKVVSQPKSTLSQQLVVSQPKSTLSQQLVVSHPKSTLSQQLISTKPNSQLNAFVMSSKPSTVMSHSSTIMINTELVNALNMNQAINNMFDLLLIDQTQKNNILINVANKQGVLNVYNSSSQKNLTDPTVIEAIYNSILSDNLQSKTYITNLVTQIGNKSTNPTAAANIVLNDFGRNSNISLSQTNKTGRSQLVIRNLPLNIFLTNDKLLNTPKNATSILNVRREDSYFLIDQVIYSVHLNERNIKGINNLVNKVVQFKLDDTPQYLNRLVPHSANINKNNTFFPIQNSSNNKIIYKSFDVNGNNDFKSFWYLDTLKPVTYDDITGRGTAYLYAFADGVASKINNKTSVPIKISFHIFNDQMDIVNRMKSEYEKMISDALDIYTSKTIIDAILNNTLNTFIYTNNYKNAIINDIIQDQINKYILLNIGSQKQLNKLGGTTVEYTVTGVNVSDSKNINILNDISSLVMGKTITFTNNQYNKLNIFVDKLRVTSRLNKNGVLGKSENVTIKQYWFVDTRKINTPTHINVFAYATIDDYIADNIALNNQTKLSDYLNIRNKITAVLLLKQSTNLPASSIMSIDSNLKSSSSSLKSIEPFENIESYEYSEPVMYGIYSNYN